MWYMQYNLIFSATKWDELLIHTTMQMNLENTMLSERILTQQISYSMLTFKWIATESKCIYTQSRIVAAYSLGLESNKGWLLNEDYGSSLLKWWKQFRTTKGWCLHIICVINATKSYHFRTFNQQMKALSGAKRWLSG